MSIAKNHFEDFSKTLREELGLEFSAHPVMDNIWQVQFEKIPLQLFYYGIGAEERLRNGPASKSIHLDEDLWVSNPKGLIARLRAQAGQARKVNARDTVISRIDKRQALQFQAEHHLNVALPGKYRFGLYLQGELVSVGVFSGGRKMRGQAPEYRSFELLRTCHKNGLIVVGGLSKLIRHFEKSFSPGDIMTYVDKDWSDGQSYLLLGFRLAGELPPQEFWIDSRTLLRYTYFDLPNEFASMDPDTRRAKGLHRLYNSGSLKLVKTC